MKVLYVTGLWKGFDDVMMEGASPGNGLPAFWEPLSLMLETGVNVKFLTIEGDTHAKPFKIGDNRIQQSDVLARVNYTGGLIGKVKGTINLRRSIKKILAEHEFDFVYLHGPSAGVVSNIVRQFRIPLGQRLYGTFLHRDILRFGLLACRFLRMNEVRSFTSPKNFLIVTNDGSQGDKVASILNRKKPPFQFFYWLNGVHKTKNQDLNNSINTLNCNLDTPFIFYCARFDRWKRQDRAVQVLSKLSSLGINANLIFAGEDKGPYYEYRLEIEQLSKNFGVQDKIFYLGHISRDVTQYLHRKAVASLFLYDVCNLGNSLHEAVAAGGAALSLKDPAVNDYIVEGVNGYTIEDENHAALIIGNFMRDPNSREKIAYTSKSWSSENILTWRERAKKELDLIYSCISVNRQN